MTSVGGNGYLYPAQGLTRLDREQPVFVLGSIEAADAVRAAGLQALGIIGPADLIGSDTLATLQGFKFIVIPAASEQGLGTMLKVGQRLNDVAREVVWYEHEPGVRHGLDLNDLLWPAVSDEDLHEMAENPQPSYEVLDRLSQVRSRLRRFDGLDPVSILMRWRGVPRLDEIVVGEVREPPLLGRIEPLPGKLTALYGPGGVGKGIVVACWVARVTRSGLRVLILDYEGHADEWADRVSSLGGDMTKVHIIEPYKVSLEMRPDWRPVPFWVAAPEFADLARVMGAALVVVDSVVFASMGHDPIAAETVVNFGMGAQQFPCPVLALAHVTKEGDYRMPFGSVFWHNVPRMTWSMEPGGKAPPMLTNRKAQHYRPLGSYRVESRWADDHVVAVDERPYQRKLAERVDAVLSGNDEGLMEFEIVMAVNEDGGGEVKANSVNKVLNRNKEAGVYDVDPNSRRWRKA